MELFDFLAVWSVGFLSCFIPAWAAGRQKRLGVMSARIIVLIGLFSIVYLLTYVALEIIS